MASIRTQSVELPRSTAYYYADLEKLKKTRPPEVQEKDPNELSEYVESNEVVNDGAVREVPPFRDRQWSLPEYNIPENGRKIEETYSTAGTFPMPEPKEKEPLLAELEVVGRLPLTELDSSQGVRRSRSWYLCCPNVADEEMSRESSWRYSSLRPVTAPPAPGQNGFHHVVASSTSGRDDVTALKIERDALARALAAERQRAATAARAHDARLAELHGVIAELVRRRAAHKQSAAIPEEELSDECESTTQPAGELDNDADQSRTEQSNSLLFHLPLSFRGCIDALDRLQRHAIRIIGDEEVTKHLEPLQLRRDVASLSAFYRLYHGECSEELFSLIPPSPFLQRTTRAGLRCHRLTVATIPTRTKKFGDSFLCRTIRKWNALPAHVFPPSYNLGSFKRGVKKQHAGRQGEDGWCGR
ncbi:hypothetical protein evm_013128 [Chilo suppressalis]|nr:hypothetical protein evm_013128 [Chilo suppressalis]